jgi:hypothetical protein
MRDAERRLAEVCDELATLAGQSIDQSDVVRALADFDGVWAALSPREQVRVLHLVVETVAHDGRAGKVAITFPPSGIKTLAAEVTP